MFTPSVVIDTNIIISGLRSNRGASFQILRLIGTGAFEMHLSVPLILEYEDVIKRNINQLNLRNRDAESFLDYLCSVSKLHEVFLLMEAHINRRKR